MQTRYALAALLFAAPLAARAELGFRIGPDATIAYHANGDTHFITDNFPLGADFMLSYYAPLSIISIDAEIAEQFFASPPNATVTVNGSTTSVSAPGRIGTVFRPGIRVSPPLFPLYARAAIPINFEQPDAYPRERFDLRLGAGLNIPLVLFKIYVEGDVDFPLGGGDNAPSAFSNWQLVLNAGLDFRF